jgi:hypothetical protein
MGKRHLSAIFSFLQGLGDIFSRLRRKQQGIPLLFTPQGAI